MDNNKKRLAVLVSGGGTNLQALINSIKKGQLNAEICAVISSRHDAYALTRAKKEGIGTYVFCKKDYRQDELFLHMEKLLKDINPHLIVLAGFMSILPPHLIRSFSGRIINTHPSLLPAFSGDGFYGERVHAAVLKRGCTLTGVTVHFVDEGTDTGPIIAQRAVKVMPGDTVPTLQKRVQRREHKLLPQAVQAVLSGAFKMQ